MMKRTLTILFATLFPLLGIPLSATADWINLTGAQSAPNTAEIYIEGDHVRLAQPRT